MDDQVQRLVDKAWRRFQEAPKDHRFMIAIGGIPGSGKTTLSRLVAGGLNARNGSPVAAFVPMDGYHLTRAQLDALPNPAEAHARRGAAFTFNGPAFLALVRRLREPLGPEATVVPAPAFDHAVKDPQENAIAIEPGHRIVVFEGNYVCLSSAPWGEAAALMDERWFVSVDNAVAEERLVKRHVRAGIAKDEAEARERARENDLVNGEEIKANMVAIDEEVVSREDASWVEG
ncbi:P-loop containing nucleoside triphosphate hydrolase protein [Xylariaceae sp. FL0804]|nr:P-loop containing nucleoside triphosphate hydrolase protein [Xylariaceae sp. FL0804]